MAGIAALAVAYILSQFFRSFLAVLTPVLSSELSMTKGDLSLASGAFFIVFALAQFGVGVSLDRFGPRRTSALLLGIVLLLVTSQLARNPAVPRDVPVPRGTPFLRPPLRGPPA